MRDEKTDDIEMYNIICEKRFDKIDGSQEKIIDLLRGKNGDPGLIDEVRTLKSRWTVIFAAIALLSTAMATQLIQWLFRVL